jgi:ABC-type antimicrobial peptide transport system permease subunit
MHAILQDLRFALRQLRKSPGFTLMAVLTLALGIGATTAVFSLVDTVLLHPLPFARPDRLVALNTLEQQHAGNGPASLPADTSYPNFFDWRDRAHSFQSMASYQGQSFTLGLANAPARRIDGMAVSADFFRVLGIDPALGRSFTRSEEQAGNRSVIISHSLWQTTFNANPSVIGQTLRLSEEIYTIIGVMPASFQFPNAPDAQAFITPALNMEGKNPSGKQRGWNQTSVIARLAPGVDITQARAEMQTIQRSLAAQYPDEDAKETAVSVVPELQDVVGDIQRPLHILFASVSFLLLIACANVAGLLLTRTAARRAELALRSALGATRPQIVRQLLLESLTLSFLGGLGGFLIAALALRLSPSFLPDDLPRIHELSLNPRVLLFALAASLLTGLLFGVFPAWRSARLDPAIALRDTTRSSTASRSQNRLHSALIVGVVGNVTRTSLDEAPQPEYYIPFAQVPLGPPTFAIRVAGDPATYDNTIRTLVAQQDSSLPVFGMRTNLLARSTAQQRFQTLLISAFAAIALLLSAIGLYAVLSYMVVQRTLELGLRLALGAQRSDVLSLILKRGLLLCVAGVAVGLIASAALTHYLTSLLFHTPALDAFTFSATTLLLLTISVASSLIPAFRASRLDPNETLRQQ